MCLAKTWKEGGSDGGVRELSARSRTFGYSDWLLLALEEIKWQYNPCVSSANNSLEVKVAKPIESIFYKNYTVQLRHSQHTYTHLYKRTYVNYIPMSIFEDRQNHYRRSKVPLNSRISLPREVEPSRIRCAIWRASLIGAMLHPHPWKRERDLCFPDAIMLC